MFRRQAGKARRGLDAGAGPDADSRLDAVWDRLDAITDQLAAVVARLGAAGGPGSGLGSGPGSGPGGPLDAEPLPDVLRELDRQVEEIRAAKEAAIDAQEFEFAVTLRNQERQLRAQRDAERELWLITVEHRRSVAAAEAAAVSAAELDRLRQMVAGLQEQVRKHRTGRGTE